MDQKDIKQRFETFNLRHRPSQLEMIKQVDTAVKSKQIACIEAPTGTGKTLSYLLGTYNAKTKKQNVIISTATIALQEQLIKKDLPLLEQIVDEKIRFAIAKGRQNYLCLAKLNQDEQVDLFSGNDEIDYLRAQVETHFWDGDKENLNDSVAPQTWQSVTTDSVGCSGKRCEFYDKCYFFKARNKMHLADFIVTNHSLLLSDLSLGSGVLLPEPENNVYIIDECHHLPHRAISHFAKSSPVLGATEWINQVGFSVGRAIASKDLSAHWQTKINQCTLALVEQIKALKIFLDTNSKLFKDSDGWRIQENEIDQFEAIKHIVIYSRELANSIEEISKSLELELELKKPNKDDESYEKLNKHYIQFKFLMSRVSDFYATWMLFCQQRKAKEPPIARWFEKIMLHNSPTGDYRCHCSPINVSSDLKELFWNKVKNGVILCSATIRSLGSFDNFLKKTGLHLIKNVNTFTMPAIFNYQQSVIFVPTMQHEPSGQNQQSHRLEVLDLLPQLILPKAGTLVLFTSKSAMTETYDRLPPDIVFDVLMQGKKSKTKLIESHKNCIRSGNRSIIFGLASFAEGIDLPADYCQHVIIHKLPFAVPSSPVELTRSEWISQHNLNPFMMATLPETSIKLTQYIGRLIRQEDDTGIVTILDRRLYSKSYGKKLLENLPDFARLINCSIDQLKKQKSVAEIF